MAFLPITGKIQSESYPKTASTAFAVGQAVVLTSGQLATATTTSLLQAGVMMRKVASTDSDYASTTPCSVWTLSAQTEFLVNGVTGTATAALVGTTCDIASGGLTADVGTDAHHQLLITGFIDASTIKVKFNSANTFKNAS